MKAYCYLPKEDRLQLRFRETTNKPTKEVSDYRLWWDPKGIVLRLDILSYATKNRKAVLERLKTARLGGIWSGVRIREEDIQRARRGLLSDREEKW